MMSNALRGLLPQMNGILYATKQIVLHLHQKHGGYMKTYTARTTGIPDRSMGFLNILLTTGLMAALILSPIVVSQAQTVPLGTAEAFAVLGASAVTNTGPSVINGDLGVSPGTAVTGFPPGIVNGTIYIAEAVALQAQSDLTTAYNDAAGRACDVDLTDQDLGGLTLTSGVYCFSSSAQLTGTVTLDAQGDSNAVFIFQIGSTLTTASNSSVSLINGALSCNVFWQIGSSATLGTTTAFIGNIMALASITLTTSATLDGRALAQTGAVTLDANTVTSGACAADTCPPVTCSDVKGIRARCRPGGLIQAIVCLTRFCPDGDIVQISIDQVPYELTLSGGTGILSIGGFSPGIHTVELTDPSGCFPALEVTCSAGLGRVGGDSWDDFETDAPSATILLGNYPNPFNPSTTISYELSAVSNVSLIVYDVLGRNVATLVDGIQQSGYHQVNFNGSNMASGLYYYRLIAGPFSDVKRLMLVK